MKAVILNSGLGKRMEDLTKNNHKSMVVLENNETIYHRQIRILNECGIKDFIVTTGPFKEQMEEAVNIFPDLNFTFVHNPIYDKTNYIYSMFLAKDYFDDDILLLHGDLVFNKEIIETMLKSEISDICLFNSKLDLPEKDFKGRIQDGLLKEVSINIFDNDCYAFQSLYKLSKETFTKWMDKIIEFVNNGEDHVYAENALNTILDELKIVALSYENDYVEEIDTVKDYERVSREIMEFEKQHIENDYKKIKNIIEVNKIKKVFIVCDEFIKDTFIIDFIDSLNIKKALFTNFTTNPKYEEVVEGINLFKQDNYDFIISIGGGSAIDVAKCINLFSNLDSDINYLNQEPKNVSVKHLCIPTTAGTGSESTRYSVIYKDKEKQSITSDSIIPEYVILESKFLETLPIYQKKATVLDALCQAIESYWSVNSTKKSKKYAKESIEIIIDNIEDYVFNSNDEINKKIMYASNLAGKGINITQTTAAHAMSYKITSLYGISHGHAVAIVLPHIWEYMVSNLDKCIDKRGKEYLEIVFNELNEIFKGNGIDKFTDLLNKLELDIPKVNKEELNELVKSVNPIRLKNNPVELNEEDIEKIYVKSLNIQISGRNV